LRKASCPSAAGGLAAEVSPGRPPRGAIDKRTRAILFIMAACYTWRCIKSSLEAVVLSSGNDRTKPCWRGRSPSVREGGISVVVPALHGRKRKEI
jgi:hypothetical protein